MKSPNLAPPCSGWQEDLPGPEELPVLAPALGFDTPNHQTHIFLELPRSSALIRGLVIWFAPIMTVLLITLSWLVLTLEHAVGFETWVIVGFGLLVIVWSLFFCVKFDVFTPRDLPLRFNRVRKRIYAYNFNYRWWNPFERWRVEPVTYDWSQVRAERWLKRGVTAQGALVIKGGVMLSIVKPGTNEVIDRFPLTSPPEAPTHSPTSLSTSAAISGAACSALFGVNDMSTITQTDNEQPKDKDPFAHDVIARVDEEDADLQFQMRGHSINPLVDAAHPLFGMVIHVRRIDKADADALYRKVCSQITAVREEARQLGYDTATQVAYSYALCAFVDEAVMSTPWGRASKWSDRSLLSHHHNETCAGEKFFTVLARMQVDPARYQHVLEVKYMCLCLGFQGKYAQQPDTQDAINDLITKLHRILRAQRGPAPTRLFDEPKVVSRRVRLARQWPLWTPYALAAVILTGVYFFFSISLEHSTEQVIRSLDAILES